MKDCLSLKKEIDRIVRETGIPYLDVSVFSEHTELFRYQSGEGVTGKELYRMYSCSKPITVTAAMRLVEQGKLSLDDKVEKYLPEIGDAFWIHESGERVPATGEMTVRHLFTMTSGFSYELQTQPILFLAKQSNGKANLRDFISAFVASPLLFKPGTKFEYSLSHDVLAAVVEVVSGKKFSAFVKEEIFDPLAMNDSRFDNGENLDDVADMFYATERGEMLPHTKENVLLPTKAYESGGAGLVSTVDDYVKFADALACDGVAKNGYRLLGVNALRELSSEQVGRLSVQNQFTCAQGDDYGYGLGVRVRKETTEWGLKKGEFGWDGAAGCYVMIAPEKKLSVFMGMNVMNWPIVFKGKHLEIVKAIYENLLKN